MSSDGAPTTTVSPAIATLPPAPSPAAASEAVSVAAWVPFAQPPAGFTNT